MSTTLVRPPSPAEAGSPLTFQTVRSRTDALCAALTAEDQCIQSMPDASPVKWHRAHTSWFFEQFVLTPSLPGYVPFDASYAFLFNSYYDAVGARHPRPRRGFLTRPGAGAIDAYRAHVDAAMAGLFERRPDAHGPGTSLSDLIQLGLHHEQQHQELLVTDMMDAFASSPLAPAVLPGWCERPGPPGGVRMITFEGGVVDIGSSKSTDFAFDNEGPRHKTFLRPYALADRLVSNGDFLAFIEDGGYRTVALWMADGWAAAQDGGWSAPAHWRQDATGQWLQFGPGGSAPLVPTAPVRHVSWYEADAFARWADRRLPTEQEWEAAAADPRLRDMTGRVWQWTESAYRPYPGFRAAPGAVGEYNGKFMINQMVLRGSSCGTPEGHARATYRNFFQPDRRWQFTGLRLAADA